MENLEPAMEHIVGVIENLEIPDNTSELVGIEQELQKLNFILTSFVSAYCHVHNVPCEIWDR